MTKINKTMTPEAVAANRANGQKSRGPKNTAASSNNAFKHGLCTARMHFACEEERDQFNTLERELQDDLQPNGALESALVSEIARCLWRSQSVDAWEARELANRRAATEAVFGSLNDSYDGTALPLFSLGNGKPAQLGWECQELTVRSGKKNSEQEEKRFADSSDKANQIQLEARLTSSFDSVLRYQAAVKRDLYRAIAALQALRNEDRRH